MLASKNIAVFNKAKTVLYSSTLSVLVKLLCETELASIKLNLRVFYKMTTNAREHVYKERCYEM